jgi:SAM-dependent methyltransferase
MHADSYKLMGEMLKRCDRLTVASALDVGSYNVNGCFRPLIEERGWSYLGLDQVAGPNVDLVAKDPFRFPLSSNQFDVVISGSTMEHVTAFWRWVPELVRVLKPGGFLAIHTHWSFMEHRYPVDCWRFLPDGLKFLFDETGQLEKYEIRIANKIDIIGSAFKAVG